MAQKTLKSKIPYQDLTQTKQQELDREYNAVQAYTQNNLKDPNHNEVSSSTKQQQDRKLDDIKPDTEYPWFLRNDRYDVQKHDNTEYNWWVNIQTADEWGGINVPIQPHEELEEYTEYCDSKITKENGEYYIHLTVEKDVDIQTEYEDVLAVDPGSRWCAVSVTLSDRNTTFYGEDIRRIRRHSYETRKTLQEKQAYQTLKQVGNREKRQIEDQLHKISRSIVEEAKERNALIVIGDLEGIQNQDKGSKMNRRLHLMPHYKLKEFVKYKAAFEGIIVVEVNEAYTSQTCNWCGETEETSRESQGLFECSSCGLEDNADKNGALNIAKRGLGKDIDEGSGESCIDFPLSKLGGVCESSLELDKNDQFDADGVSVSVKL